MTIGAPVAAEVDNHTTMSRRGSVQRRREIGCRLARFGIDAGRAGAACRRPEDDQECEQRREGKMTEVHWRYYCSKPAARRDAPSRAAVGENLREFTVAGAGGNWSDG